jgi:hypothetical protein
MQFCFAEASGIHYGQVTRLLPEPSKWAYMSLRTEIRLFSLGKKGQAVPLQAWSDPEGSRKLRYPDFLTTAHDGGKVVSPTHRPHLPPENKSFWSDCLEPGGFWYRLLYFNGGGRRRCSCRTHKIPSFICRRQPIIFFLYSNTATCFGPKMTNFGLPTQKLTVK